MGFKTPKQQTDEHRTAQGRELKEAHRSPKGRKEMAATRKNNPSRPLPKKSEFDHLKLGD